MPQRPTSEELGAALRASYPELAEIRQAAESAVYLVGGAVRDLLLGKGRSDLDLVVVGDATELAARLGAETMTHERFATAKAKLDGHTVDIATARTETYAAPGALPDVIPTAEIAEDLRRRDFTINAMAIELSEPPSLIDPHGGQADLEGRLLRVLHSRSFVDDPTRALRAARYAARLDLELADETARLIREADLTTVSTDRREAELLRLAREPNAPRGFELLAEWGVLPGRPGGVELAKRVLSLLAGPPWRGEVSSEHAVLAAAVGPAGGEDELVVAAPRSPSEAVALARSRPAVELVLARALGADWLDRYMAEWRSVALEIDGGDLIAAGVEEGPALGRGLSEALRRKLDGEIAGREQELSTALAAAQRDR